MKNKGNILTKESIIRKIEENKEKIRSLGVVELTLFGSYARNEATADSDIDFIVKFEKGRGMFNDFIHLYQFLKELFGKEIEIGKEELIREELKESILRGKKVEANI